MGAVGEGVGLWVWTEGEGWSNFWQGTQNMPGILACGLVNFIQDIGCGAFDELEYDLSDIIHGCTIFLSRVVASSQT